MIFWFLIISVVLKTSNAIIYHLNDTEYERMPALFAMDPYEPCMKEGGVYCVAQLHLYSEEPNELYTMIQEYSKHVVKHYNYSIIDRAVCLTKSCTPFMNQNKPLNNEDLHDILEACLSDYMWKEYKLRAKVVNLFNCDKSDHKIEKDAIDWFMAVIIVCIVMVNLLGTSYDMYKEKIKFITPAPKIDKYLMSFSMFGNLKQLFSAKLENARSQSFQGFHGVKTVAMALMLYAHMTLLITAGYTADPHTFEKTYEVYFHRLCSSSLVLVQIFFVLSGFLMIYPLEVRSEKNPIPWNTVPKMIFVRWLRLTTICGLLVGFQATWMRHLGSGPLWHRYVINQPVADCRQYWWSHLLYINNYVLENSYCVFPTWHVASDMQLFILGTIAYFATRNAGRKLVFSILILLGMLLPALHVWYQDLDGITLPTPELYRNLNGDTTYRYIRRPGHNNIVCFVIGMSTAVIANNMQKKQIDYSNNKILKILSWCSIPALAGVFAAAMIFFEDGDRASMATRMFYALTHRAAVGIIIASGILFIVCKCNHMTETLFSWHGWTVASRLMYIVTLMHPVFLHWLLGIRTELQDVSYSYVLKVLVAVVIASYTLAIPLYVMVEAPTCNLIALMAARTQHKKTE